MKALLQRVSHASVSVGGTQVGEIGRGLVVLVGIARGDREEDAKYLAGKTAGLRIFPDAQGKFQFSVQDIKGDLLVISQFTLLAHTRKGRRPDFTAAAPPGDAQTLFHQFVELVKATGLRIETGHFQEHMLVEIWNDGPVTLLLDSRVREEREAIL